MSYRTAADLVYFGYADYPYPHFAIPPQPLPVYAPQYAFPFSSRLPPAAASERIQHIALFSLRPELGSQETKSFLHTAKAMLASLPGVQNFRILCQFNPENDYPFALSLEFANTSAFEAFTAHPAHTKWVEEQWNKKVERYFISNLKHC